MVCFAPPRKQVDGALLVHEPNFFGNPFEEELVTLDNTFTVTSQQTGFAGRFQSIQCKLAFHEKIVLSKGALTQEKIYLERIQPSAENNDSGWYIGNQDCRKGNPEKEDPGELEAIYAFQLLKSRPGLIQILTLPAGYMVFIDGDKVTNIVNDSGNNISVA